MTPPMPSSHARRLSAVLARSMQSVIFCSRLRTCADHEMYAALPCWYGCHAQRIPCVMGYMPAGIPKDGTRGHVHAPPMQGTA